ncbi:MAG: (2Fe-2S)-binding protein [Bdellovibrionales bacterium]|nr:(2Fe-2S)-binding protein [Bdellovibrionales bacterium]
MSDEDLICVCMTVTRGEILEAIRRGITTIEGLKAELFCCTGCGTCEPKVRKILEEVSRSS